MLFRDPFATRVHPLVRPPPLCLSVSLSLSLCLSSVCVCVSLSVPLSLSPTTLCWAPRVANLFGQVWVGTRRAQRSQRPGVTVPGGNQCRRGAPLWRWRKHKSNIEAGTPRLLLPHSPRRTHTHIRTPPQTMSKGSFVLGSPYAHSWRPVRAVPTSLARPRAVSPRPGSTQSSSASPSQSTSSTRTCPCRAAT